ncbi:MAG: MBOAT family O-acyltransferase [Verrucomicrobiota bacterium]
MHFNSLVFPIFLLGVLLLQRGLPPGARRVFLVLASYLFYGAAHPFYCGLLLLSTLVDYSAGLALGRTEDPGRRKAWVGLSVLVNLGLLGVFKYGDFIIGSINAFGPGLPLPGFVLPVGISFYTFQTIAYTIDVYRRKVEPESSFLHFALFVSFFPQLVAGPIERAKKLLPQLRDWPPPSAEDRAEGFQRILWGFVKKLVFADHLGLLVHEVYSAPAEAGGPALALGTLAFTFQLYLDFSAYSDIAIGSARMMGIRLSENFRWPLVARNPTDFWARWHITLTEWFRDYVFTPMGGTSRKRPWRTYRNLLVLVTLIGLWHGASWNFVVFGLGHGLCLVVYHALRTRPGRGRRGPLLGTAWWSTPAAVLIWAFFINFWAILFRADSFADAWIIIGRIARWEGSWDPRHMFHLGLVVMVWLVHIARDRWANRSGFLANRSPIVRALWWTGLILLILFGSVDATERFIYYRF